MSRSFAPMGADASWLPRALPDGRVEIKPAGWVRSFAILPHRTLYGSWIWLRYGWRRHWGWSNYEWLTQPEYADARMALK